MAFSPQVVQPTLGLADADDLEAADNATESSSIYVKNVAWSTTDQRLMKLFDPVVSAAGGTIRAAKVAKRKDSSGKVLSAGYAFVECSSEAIAKLTIRKLQVKLHPFLLCLAPPVPLGLHSLVRSCSSHLHAIQHLSSVGVFKSRLGLVVIHFTCALQSPSNPLR